MISSKLTSTSTKELKGSAQYRMNGLIYPTRLALFGKMPYLARSRTLEELFLSNPKGVGMDHIDGKHKSR